MQYCNAAAEWQQVCNIVLIKAQFKDINKRIHNHIFMKVKLQILYNYHFKCGCACMCSYSCICVSVCVCGWVCACACGCGCGCRCGFCVWFYMEMCDQIIICVSSRPKFQRGLSRWEVLLVGLAFQVLFWCSFQVKINLKEKTSICCKIPDDYFPLTYPVTVLSIYCVCNKCVHIKVKHTWVASAGPTVTVLVEEM